MSQQFYVSPEQVMKDRADYARKGIARGRSVVVLAYAGGIAFVAENPSRALHKVSEIYDRIGFAAVGKYNEFENLRVAGVRYADMRGYSYDRRDVTARGLANAYAQTLGTVFTQEHKPYEVEIVVAEVGRAPADDQIYRLTYDGSVADEQGYVVMGGNTEALATVLARSWRPGMHLGQALQCAIATLATPANGGPPRELDANTLEVAVLDRTRPRRTFRRIPGQLLTQLLSAQDPMDDLPETDEPVVTTSGNPVPTPPPTGQPGQPSRPGQPGRPGRPDEAAGEPAGGPGPATNPQTQRDDVRPQPPAEGD